MFSKTTGVNLKNIINTDQQPQQPIQFDTKSRTAYSRVTPHQQGSQHQLQQFDNKT